MKLLLVLIITIILLTAVLIPITKGEDMKGFCDMCGKLSFSLRYEKGRGVCNNCKEETVNKIFIGCRACNDVHRCYTEGEAKYKTCEECFVNGEFCEEQETSLVQCYAGLCPVCSKQIFMEIARRDYGRNLYKMCAIL